MTTVCTLVAEMKEPSSYYEIDDNSIPFLKRMSSRQLKNLFRFLSTEQLEVEATESVSCSEIPLVESRDDQWKNQEDHPIMFSVQQRLQNCMN